MAVTTEDIAAERPQGRPLNIAQIGRDVAYLVSALPIGIATFTIAITGLSLSVGLAIVVLGIPALLVTLIACRWFADVERRRASWALREALRAPERQWSGGWWNRSLAAATDPAAWRNFVWSLALLPIGIATATIAIALWATALGLLTSPLWYWALPDSDGATIALVDEHSLGYGLLRALIGAALVPLVALACRALAAGVARLARLVLSGGASDRSRNWG